MMNPHNTMMMMILLNRIREQCMNIEVVYALLMG
jgi:hypothetical protein